MPGISQKELSISPKDNDMPTNAAILSKDALASRQLQGDTPPLAMAAPLHNIASRSTPQSLARSSPIVPKEHVAEAPTPNQANATPLERAQATEPDSEAELVSLAERVAKIWESQHGRELAVKKSQAALRETRARLGEGLHALKALHVKMGRMGRWSSTLRERGIPRATADRYVAAHEAKLRPTTSGTLAGDAATKPCVAPVVLAKSLAKRLRKSLVTEGAVTDFLRELETCLRQAREEPIAMTAA